MDVKNLFVFVVLLLLQSCVKAQYANCDKSSFINAVGASTTISHASSIGSCRYKIFAPADSIVQATCTITSTCGTHIFYMSRNGEVDLRDGLSYCGSGSVPVMKSVGNEIVVAIDTKGTFSASFSCQFSSIRIDDTNCDCGWSVDFKIVGGTTTKINGYVSHGALVDKATKELFCGVSLRELN